MPYASRVPPTLLVAEYHQPFFLDPSPQEAVPCRPNPCLVEAGKKKDAPKNGNGATLGFEEMTIAEEDLIEEPEHEREEIAPERSPQ